MLVLAVGALWLQSHEITLKAGYYTLGEAAAEIARQGVPVRATDCAADVYAIRASHVDWKDLRAALEEDGRLTFVDGKDGIRIRRSDADKLAGKTALRSYLAAVATPIHTLYASASERCKKLQSVPQDERVKVASTEQVTGDDPGRDVVTTWASGNMPYMTIAVARALSAPDPQFSRLVESTLETAPGILMPDGDMRHFQMGSFDAAKLDDARFANFVRTGRVEGRLSFDPMTCVAKCMTMGYSAEPTAPMLGLGVEQVSPLRVRIAPDRKSILDAPALAALAARSSATQKLLGSPELAASQDLGTGSIPASEALLRWAEASGVDVASYVPQFSDYCLRPAQAMSLAKVVEDVNAGHVDAAWLHTVAEERVGSEAAMGRLAAFAFAPTLTLSRKAGFLVLRNELRFLDGLCASPPGPPAAWENKLLEGGKPAFVDVGRHLLALRVSQWPDSYFSSNYLRFCNPIAMRPFAALLDKSPTLRDKLRHLRPGQSVTVPLPEVEPAAQTALKSAIIECAPYADGDCAWGDATMMGILLRDNEGRNPKIEMRNDGGRYAFRFVQYDESPWSAWLDNVDVR
ncbi:MAG TPA: hypothetical protein VHE55_01105 [Fimbriimonadaceae bacterium]|nr:hypothetical protein [Fimbriimonadaceae bacterium]